MSKNQILIIEEDNGTKTILEKPIKKIDFEITNPDDLDIDDKGQLGLF